jgi:hypothetical protein
MFVEQRILDSAAEWTLIRGDLAGHAAHLVFLFGDRQLLEDGHAVAALRQRHPSAHVVAASTSGEITDDEVTEGRLVATAIAFERTRVRCAQSVVLHSGESYEGGKRLALALKAEDLVHIFAVSDGEVVNGTDLARGFNEHLPAGVRLSGALAGDGTHFERTVVGLDETPAPGRVVAVGFYGSGLRVAFGSSGGWEPFGPQRVVTRSSHNTLFELDGQSALALYTKYLGDQAAELPGSALRFPLSVTPAGASHAVVRTILSIDEASRAMVFAGDIPQGSRVRFMRASYEDLIDGASRAAEQTGSLRDPELALCISCVGRRIVLGQRAEEETESVRMALGPKPVLAGFYSYGELAPADVSVACQLHNQTMTITTLREIP